MKVVLFRHAQKGIMPMQDPELTENGFQQAELIERWVQKKDLPPPTQAWASPRIRTAQTLKPVCESFQIKAEQTELLDQRLQSESSAQFRKRVGTFLETLESKKQSDEVHYICTHYDWIEEGMALINCDKDLNSFEFSHWAPAQYVVFELSKQIENKLWKFLKKGQP